VLVVNTNRERSPQALLPLGACCVASAAVDAGHDTRFLDLCFARRPVPIVERTCAQFQPDVVGLSIRNLDNCDFCAPRSYLCDYAEIIKAIRRSCSATIVIGGPAVSQAPQALLKRLGCQIAVAGEGERAFPALLGVLGRGGDPASVVGVFTVASQAPALNPPKDLDDLPDPRLGKWLDMRAYRAWDSPLPLQTKRGCEFDCAHCCYPALEGRAWRLRSPEWVAQQVAEASNLGLRWVEFVDSVFGWPEEHSVASCEAIARVQRKIALATLDLNPVGCTDALIEAMNAAGFTAVGVSADSGADKMLSALNKPFRRQDIASAVERLRKLKARKLWLFMIGGPGENEETVRETADFIESLPLTDLVLVTYGVRVLPNTRLRETAIAEGIISEDDPLIEPTFYFSNQIAPERARGIIAAARFPSANMVTLSDTSHGLASLPPRLFRLLGATPPFWRYVRAINRLRRLARI